MNNEIERGRLAQQLIDNPLWLETWQRFHDATLEKWESSAAGNKEEREMLWLTLKVAKKIRLEIEEILRTGVGPESGSDPTCTLSVSKNAGQTFGNQRTTSIGKIGEYMKRAIWKRLGRAYDWTFKFRITSPVKVAIMGGWLEGS